MSASILITEAKIILLQIKVARKRGEYDPLIVFIVVGNDCRIDYLIRYRFSDRFRNILEKAMCDAAESPMVVLRRPNSMYQTASLYPSLGSYAYQDSVSLSAADFLLKDEFVLLYRRLSLQQNVVLAAHDLNDLPIGVQAQILERLRPVEQADTVGQNPMLPQYNVASSVLKPDFYGSTISLPTSRIIVSRCLERMI